MSWGNELRPQPLTIAEVAKDLWRALKQYRSDGLSFKETAAFLFLRIVQKLAYVSGWHLEKRRQKEVPGDLGKKRKAM